MCIGTPLQVVAHEDDRAWCAADGQRELLDMRLVGAVPTGTWVLAFMGAARQVLDPLEAERARQARQALAAVLAGRTDIDDCFADLLGREPTLPAHLQPGLHPPAAPAAPVTQPASTP